MANSVAGKGGNAYVISHGDSIIKGISSRRSVGNTKAQATGIRRMAYQADGNEQP